MDLPAAGMLCLPNPYVAPGGRFNEIYEWGSYFIVLWLEADHREVRAKGMVENFLFEIAHYGGVLNANRTYYLTRSQPERRFADFISLTKMQPALVWWARCLAESSAPRPRPGETSFRSSRGPMLRED